MIGSRPDVSEALRRLRAAVGDGRLDALADENGLRLLVLFGSAGRGEAARDLDLAYLADHDTDHWRLLADLVDLAGTELIDLVDLAEANVLLRAEALVGEPLLERAPASYADEQMAAVTQAMDTRWLRELSLETMAAGGRSQARR